MQKFHEKLFSYDPETKVFVTEASTLSEDLEKTFTIQIRNGDEVVYRLHKTITNNFDEVTGWEFLPDFRLCKPFSGWMIGTKAIIFND